MIALVEKTKILD